MARHGSSHRNLTQCPYSGVVSEASLNALPPPPHRCFNPYQGIPIQGSTWRRAWTFPTRTFPALTCANADLTGANFFDTHLEEADLSNEISLALTCPRPVLISADLRVYEENISGIWTGAAYFLNAVDSGGGSIPDNLFPSG